MDPFRNQHGEFPAEPMGRGSRCNLQESMGNRLERVRLRKNSPNPPEINNKEILLTGCSMVMSVSAVSTPKVVQLCHGFTSCAIVCFTSTGVVNQRCENMHFALML